jgi:predicted aldo/keto reductase-like oxidoreductase
MIHRRFGRTGLDMPVLSAGFMRAMYSWQHLPAAEIPPASQRNFAEVVRTALDLGINHFETANAYGTSEQQLGRALRDIPRDSFFLQTKVQPAARPKKFIEDFHASLSRLGVERVDLLAIHGINDYRALWQACREDGCLAAARRLQQQGKVGAVGFSGHCPVDVIVEAVRHGADGGFDYVNLHWYYIYQILSCGCSIWSGAGACLLTDAGNTASLAGR